MNDHLVDAMLAAGLAALMMAMWYFFAWFAPHLVAFFFYMQEASGFVQNFLPWLFLTTLFFILVKIGNFVIANSGEDEEEPWNHR